MRARAACSRGLPLPLPLTLQQNIVVYEALKGADGKLNAAKPVEVYWLDIDPEYVAAARKKGVQSDRVDLNAIERQFAYGVSAEPIQGAAAGRYNLKLVALPERPVTMYLDAEGKLHGTIAVNGAQVDLVRIYVHAVDRMLRTPKVEYVDLVGQDAEGKYVHERIIPK